jgi:phage-related protein
VSAEHDFIMVNREIRFYKHYFNEFFVNQNETTRKKIVQTLVWLRELKSIEGVKGLYEIRVEAESNIFRIFCCFDRGNLIILFNGFQKKSQKTPPKEIEKAKRLMDEYFNNLNNGTNKE